MDKLVLELERILRGLCSQDSLFYNENENPNNSEDFLTFRFGLEMHQELFGFTRNSNNHLRRIILEKIDGPFEIEEYSVDSQYNRMTNIDNITSPKSVGGLSRDELDRIEQCLIQFRPHNIHWERLKLELEYYLNKLKTNKKFLFKPDLLIHIRNKQVANISNIKKINLVMIEAKVCTNIGYKKRDDVFYKAIYKDFAKLFFNYYRFRYGYYIFARYCTYGKIDCMKLFHINFHDGSISDRFQTLLDTLSQIQKHEFSRTNNNRL